MTNVFKEFTEQHEALYTYFNAYIASGSKDHYSITPDELERDIVYKFGEVPDSFIQTALSLLEVNVNVTVEKNCDGDVIVFKGVCFSKDYTKLRENEVNSGYASV
jgi:hypothetical protein